MIIKCLITFILIAYGVAVDSKDECISVMSSIEQAQEKDLNVEIQNKLKDTLGEEPRLISKIFLFVMQKNQEVFSLSSKIINSIQLYKFYAIIFCSILILCIRFIPSLRKISNSIFTLIPKQKQTKIILIIIIILCVFLVMESFKGVKQSEKHNKNINYLLCQIMKHPSNMLKGQLKFQQQGIDGLQRYVEQALASFMSNYMQLKPALFRLQATQQIIKASSTILKNMDNSTQSVQYGSKIAQVKKLFQIAFNYSTKRPQNLYDAYRIPNRVLQFTLLINSIAKSTTYISNKFNISAVISFFIGIQSIFFYFVGLIGLTFPCFFYYANQLPNNKYRIWLQYCITSTLGLCLVIFITSSFLLPPLFWSSNAFRHTLFNEEHFFEEFILLNDFNPQITQSISMIIPINRSLITMYNGNFQKQTKTIIQTFQPFTQKNSTYFYNLYRQSLQYISNEEIKTKIQKQLQQHLIKQQNFIQPITTTHRTLKNIIALYEEHGKFQKINRNTLGKFITDLCFNFLTLIQNRFFAIKQISKQFICYLLIMLVISLIGQTKPQKISGQKQCKEISQVGLSQTE